MTIAPGLAGRTLIKGHAAGNDFLLLIDAERATAVTAGEVAAVCDRRTGLGADGLVRLTRTAALPGTEHFRATVPEAEWFLDYYQSDGAPVVGAGAAYGAACLVLAAVLDAEGLEPLTDGASTTIGTRGGARTVTRLGGLWAVDVGRARRAELDGPAADAVREGWDTLVRIPGLEEERAALSLDLPGRHAVVALGLKAEFDAAELGPAGAGRTPVYTPAPNAETTLVLTVPLGEHADTVTGERVGRARVRVLAPDKVRAGVEACCAAAVALHEWSGAGAPADYLLSPPGGEVGVHVGADPLAQGGALLATAPVELVGRITLI
ncbi:diaminopimelate epimerase [Actinomyces sp.]|uniref:diaminopimelate epimerase n=1 Tax=Actinomyces sp. TaxID=29317 RepID=UPI0026DD0740|nr:diaminopimelate epimerase [Actinomyces sp.]MDO4899128.1 diaminopimelate epimerase [Actinomyces sp.]